MADSNRPFSAILGRISLPLLIIYWIALFAGTHLEFPDDSSIHQLNDKLLHFGAYTGLAFLLGLTLSFRRKLNATVLLMTFSGLILYAIADELLQIPVGRDCNLLDFLADCAGIFFGLGLFIVVKDRIPRE